MSIVQELIAKAEAAIADLDGDARQELQDIITELKAGEAKVAADVTALIEEAKAAITTAVAGTVPEVSAEVKAIIAKLEADIQALFNPA